MKRIACLADIVIDREAEVARFGMWGIPAVTPILCAGRILARTRDTRCSAHFD